MAVKTSCVFICLTQLCMLATVSAGSPPLTMSYYEVLGVGKNATALEMKRRYRRLALTHHPDKVQGTDEEKDEAAQRFLVIAHGYKTLANDTTRERYEELLRKGIFEYDEDQWEELQMRKHGWKSPMEIDKSERQFLAVCAILLVAFGVWLAYTCIKKEIAYKKKTKENKAKRVATMAKQLTKISPASGRAKSAAQIETEKRNYQKVIKTYHKECKKTLRGHVQDHSVWFAPQVASEDINLLCAHLSPDQLVTFTRQLCAAFDVSPPYPPLPPTPEDEEASQAARAELDSRAARTVIKELAVIAGTLRSTKGSVLPTETPQPKLTKKEKTVAKEEKKKKNSKKAKETKKNA